METSAIQEFYKGKMVFLTGGTGFMGKVLIEKLLRDTEVDTIFVLVREKKGKSCETRLDEIFNDVLFERLRTQKPKFRNRVEAISGDCSISGLGISIPDREKLITKTNIIFHAAATVNFNEHIKLAYNINVNAIKEILDIAREMKDLKSIIHVSTAYANCNRKSIEEKIYDMPISCSDIEIVLDKMTKHESEIYTETLLGDWPNTYTFTKALAETVVKNRGKGLPIGIFRPSIILCTYKEPLVGWTDNLYGPTGLALGSLSGIVRVAPGDGTKVADLIPIDTCVAAIIASGWDVVRKLESNQSTLPIYNYVSSAENPVLWQDFININYYYGLECPSIKNIWYPTITLVSNNRTYNILKLVYHIIPALFFDLAALVVGGKPRLLQIYQKVHKFSNIIQFFSTHEWTFTNKNVQTMWSNLNRTDQELFPFSMASVHWLNYFRHYTPAIKKYLLKDTDSRLEEAQTKLRRLKVLHIGIQWLLMGLLFNFGTSCFFSLAKRILSLIMP